MSLANDIGMLREHTIPEGMQFAQSRISATYRPGSIVMHRIGSKLAEVPLSASPRTDLVIMGMFVGNTKFAASSTDDTFGGSLNADGDPEIVTVAPGTIGWFATGSGVNAITSNAVDKPAYVYDDDTYYLTDNGGTLSFGGFVNRVRDDGRVEIRMEETVRPLYALFSPGESSSGFTSDGTARLVATNLAAGTFSGGVWTATANGALATQDGVAPAVGDVLILPLGTLTTLAVGAADEGPYEVTSLGAAGSKVVLTRPARFQHGELITPGTKFIVGGAGTVYKNTVWIAKPATATKVVGTDDPLMFPAEMIVAKTLASGTASIATVPLRGAGLFYVGIDFTGGSPAATTTSLQASTQTPGGLGTASIVIQEQSVLGTLVATGSATCNVIVRQ